MKIVAEFDFNNGKKSVLENYEDEYNEIKRVIELINSDECKTKISAEKTMNGKVLYSPSELNTKFKNYFSELDWHPQRVMCDYRYGNFLDDYVSPSTSRNAFREMDFIKTDKKIGVEVQFGKYAFMVYNVCAKMTIFKKLGIIDTGIEIVPVKNFAEEMSTGVSYFEQFAWDLSHRGVSDIDIPVFILGIDAD